jgi:hypothetical protein
MPTLDGYRPMSDVSKPGTVVAPSTYLAVLAKRLRVSPRRAAVAYGQGLTSAAGWAAIGCSRRQVFAERAVLPVTFGALDGEASWRQAGRDRSANGVSS